MNDKNQILTALQHIFDEWESLLGSLNEARILSPHHAGNRTTKDDLAHLHAWQQRSIARLEAALHDREPQYPHWPADLDPEREDVDKLNDWIYQSAQDQPWLKVHQAWRDGFLRFLELAQAIPEEDLFVSGRYPWLPDYPLARVLTGSYEHHYEHLEQLQAWLEREV